MAGKKIAVIHTSLTVIENMDREIKKQIPDADIHNIIDEKLLSDVIRYGGVNRDIRRRMCLYVQAAESMGADYILNACSSVGEAFDTAEQLTAIPCLKIDQAMAETAVHAGHSVAVYGTVGTTLKPSADLIRKEAEKAGRRVEVTPYLIEGAFQVLAEKNVQKHNQMVKERIIQTHLSHDVIVLAQASMAVLVPELKELGKPILYSMESGIRRLKEELEK